MTRVILTLVLLCQPFYLLAADVGFSEPALLESPSDKQPKIVIVHDPAATRALSAQAEVVSGMIARGITALTGRSTPDEAWRSLVSTQDVVGIKVHSTPGTDSGTRPAVVAGIVKGLLQAGHTADHIIIWDRRLVDLRAARYDQLARALGVRLAGATDAGFDAEGAYENPVLGRLVFGDLEFSRAAPGGATNEVVGRRSHFSRLITRDITRHIIVAPLLNHNAAGVSGLLYTMAGAATDNFFRFESNPAVLARAVPEIFGDTRIADRIALNVVDALIGQYEGSQRTMLHYSATLNELRFGTDPVALDMLSLEDLNRIREQRGVTLVTNRAELYINARWLELGTDDLRRVEIIRAD
jgi:hypothetical protein